MLREALPEIVTETLPGPKAQAILDRRHAVIPNAIGLFALTGVVVSSTHGVGAGKK